ncbi:MAG: hypothetical protein J0I33_07725 [Microbacterium ginsengisoli]|jgi:hypothetical protein|nr:MULTISPECIES: hypothetical protein [unclassified Microbacterium]MBN9198512.1 hypothetical protein [Microbacterium ginsengisoli]
MPTRQRKARKRAGIAFTKTPKTAPSVPTPPSLGLTSMAEILAGLVIRGR